MPNGSQNSSFLSANFYSDIAYNNKSSVLVMPRGTHVNYKQTVSEKSV